MNTEGKNLSGNTAPSNTCALERRNRRMGRDRRKGDDPNYNGPERRSFGRRRMSDEIEALFVRLGRMLCRHRFKALALVMVVVALSGAMIPRLTVDTSSEALLHEDDPVLQEYNRFGFFTGVIILVALLTDFVVAPALMVLLTGRDGDVGATEPQSPR